MVGSAKSIGGDTKLAVETIHPFATKHWIILFALFLGTDIVRLIAPWLGASMSQHIAIPRWGWFIAFVAILVFSTRVGDGSFARLAAKRMGAQTGSPLIWIVVMPSVLSLVVVIIQTRNLDHIVLLKNLFSYDYHDTTYLYTARYWFEDWFGSLFLYASNIWLTVLILSISDQRKRDVVLGSFLGLVVVMGYLNTLTIRWFYSSGSYKFHVYSPSWIWFDVVTICWPIATWFIYRVLERGFRPSLLPVTILLVLDSLYRMMFERSTGIYHIIELVFVTGIIWLALRHSKAGNEHWSEIQQSREASPS